MSRVITTENATVTREYLSPTTTIRWDPLSNTGSLTYTVEEYLFIDDQFVQSKVIGDSSITLEQMVTRNYDIEVEPGVFTTVPGGLIMLAFKKAFEDAIAANQVYTGQPVAAPVQFGDDPVIPPLPTEEPTV
jgi:hypothetical protein